MMIGAGYVFDRSKWRKVNARYHGITRSMIPDAPWTVLKLLRVGGNPCFFELLSTFGVLILPPVHV